MAWVVLRDATDEDYVRLRESARRFIVRHGLGGRASIYDGPEYVIVEDILGDL